MAATHDFPSDLLAGQEELHQVRAKLLALLKRLPWSVAPADGFSDDNGWRRVERPASPGWTADEQAQVEKLRERERELAVFVSCHRHWSELAAQDRVDARMTLKHTRQEPPPPTLDSDRRPPPHPASTAITLAVGSGTGPGPDSGAGTGTF